MTVQNIITVKTVPITQAGPRPVDPDTRPAPDYVDVFAQADPSPTIYVLGSSRDHAEQAVRSIGWVWLDVCGESPLRGLPRGSDVRRIGARLSFEKEVQLLRDAETFGIHLSYGL